MNKKAKIYCINLGGNFKNIKLGGNFKNIKAYSKKHIAESLKISINDINFDCTIFSLQEWEEDIKENNIDIDLTSE